MSINTPTDLAGPRSKIISRAIGWGTDNIQKGLASFIDRLHNLPSDSPNYLAAPEPEKRSLPFRPLVLLGLTLLCLILRTLIALRIDSICPDGIRYIQLAEALKEGR